MAGRTGRRRANYSSPVVDLDVVFADDEWVDAIAMRPWGPPCDPSVVGGAERFRGMRPRSEQARRDFSAGGRGQGTALARDPLSDLLESWRDELAVRPLPEPPFPGRIGGTEQPTRVPAKRSLRAALSIAAAIAALLVGTASLGSKDAPQGSALWPITRILWPERAESVWAADRARIEIDEAVLAMKEGRPADAQAALGRAAEVLVDIEEVDGLADLQHEFDSLLVTATPREYVSAPRPATGDRPLAAVDASHLPTVSAPGPAGSSAAPAAAGQPAPVPADRAVIIAAGQSGGSAGNGSAGSGSSGSAAPALPDPLSAHAPVRVPDAAASGLLPATAPATPSLPEAVPAPIDEPAAATPPATAIDPPVVEPSSQPQATEQSPPAPTASEAAPDAESVPDNAAGSDAAADAVLTADASTQASLSPDATPGTADAATTD